MSHTVVSEVLERSLAKGADRLVLLVLAETAYHDGVGWLHQEKIAKRALVSVREVKRAIKELGGLGELEVRKAQRGRRRIGVYRVMVGKIGLVEVEYDRLPFSVDHPFSDLAGGRTVLSSEADEGTGEAATRGRTVRSYIGVQEPPVESSFKPAPPQAAKRKFSKPERDAMCEALAVACDWQIDAMTKEAGRILGVSASEILNAGGTVEMIPRAVRRYRKRYEGAAVTPKALANHWPEIVPPTAGTVRPPCPECGIGGGLHASDCPEAKAA